MRGHAQTNSGIGHGEQCCPTFRKFYVVIANFDKNPCDFDFDHVAALMGGNWTSSYSEALQSEGAASC